MENQTKKLQLNDLSVDSFVTELADSLVFTIKGGNSEAYCDPRWTLHDYCWTLGNNCDNPPTFEESCNC